MQKNYFNRGIIAPHPFYSVIALLAHIAINNVLFLPDVKAAGFNRVESAGAFQLFGNQPVHLSRLYRKDVKAGERYAFPKVSIPVGLSSLKLESLDPGPWTENDGELLYNNIRLPVNPQPPIAACSRPYDRLIMSDWHL